MESRHQVLKPLGHRVHIRPDRPVEQTQGGIIIAPAYADTPPMSGTVIALGEGPKHDRRVRTQAIRDCIAAAEEVAEQFRYPACVHVLLENLGHMLRIDPPAEHDVRIGDRVIFPMDSGHEVVFGEGVDAATVILDEESVLAVIEQEQEQVA